MNTADLEQQTVDQLTKLSREFAGTFSAEQIRAVGRAEYDGLRGHATVDNFIPLLVYRLTKEELLRRASDFASARSA